MSTETTLAEVKARMDRGDFKGMFSEVVVDNDCTTLLLWESEAEALADNTYPEYIKMNWGMEFTVEALTLLGFNARQV